MSLIRRIDDILKFIRSLKNKKSQEQKCLMQSVLIGSESDKLVTLDEVYTRLITANPNLALTTSYHKARLKDEPITKLEAITSRTLAADTI